MARSLADAIRQDPTAAILFVVRNNPEAVDANLTAEGMGSGTDEARSVSLSALMKHDRERLLQVLDVPLIPERMSPEERGQVLDAVNRFGQPMARGGVFIDNDPPPDVFEGTTTAATDPEGGNWNWNDFASLLVGAGLTIYEQETGGGNGNGGGQAPTPAMLPSWLVPVVVVVVLAVAALAFWTITRKRR